MKFSDCDSYVKSFEYFSVVDYSYFSLQVLLKERVRKLIFAPLQDIETKIKKRKEQEETNSSGNLYFETVPSVLPLLISDYSHIMNILFIISVFLLASTFL